MFWSKNKKKVYPCKPQFYYIKVGCKGVFVTRTCIRDESAQDKACMFVDAILARTHSLYLERNKELMYTAADPSLNFQKKEMRGYKFLGRESIL